MPDGVLLAIARYEIDRSDHSVLIFDSTEHGASPLDVELHS